MPINIPSLAGLRSLEKKASAAAAMTPFKPATSSFINNITAKTRAPSDPGLQARGVISGEGASAPIQKVSNFQANIKGIGDWGRQATNQARASNLAKRAAKSAQVQLESQMRAQQSSSPSRKSGGATAVRSSAGSFYSGPVSGARSHLVKQAQSMLGTPYAWGGGGYGNRGSRGTGKGTQNVIGVDCSGLTSYVYGTLGIKLARQSDAQLRTAGYKTSVDKLQPGDLVGWARGGHVALYIGNGQIIESPKPGATVRTRSLSSYDYNGGVYGVRVKLPGE